MASTGFAVFYYTAGMSGPRDRVESSIVAPYPRPKTRPSPEPWNRPDRGATRFRRSRVTPPLPAMRGLVAA
jgi:hypothetical protein